MTGPPRVLLVAPPWATVQAGSLPLAVLGDALRRQGVPCGEWFANMALAEELGLELYEAVADQDPLLAEGLFAEWVYPGADPTRAIEALGRRVARSHGAVAARALDVLRLKLPELRAGLGRFFERAAGAVRFGDYRLSYFAAAPAQGLASVALARRIKERHPEVKVAVGGAGPGGELGPALARAFQEIDFAASAEAEQALPELVEALAGARALEQVAGLTFRRGEPPLRELDRAPIPDDARRLAAVRTERPIPDLDRAPWPDYAPYLTAVRGSKLSVTPRLVLEWSRRPGEAKGPRRAIKEVLGLARRCEVLSFELASAPLPSRYFQDVVPALARLQARYDLRFAVEVEPTLEKEQVAMLHEAGVRMARPAIDGFSGTAGLRAVQAIKWLEEYGIQPRYGLRVDVPGEAPEDYRRLLEWLPSLVHLRPPASVTRATPPPDWGRPGIASLFEPDPEAPELDALHRELQEKCDDWRKRFRRGLLVYRSGPGFVTIRDARHGPPRRIQLTGLDADLYRHLDRLGPIDAAAAAFREVAPEQEVRERIRRLADQRLVLEDGQGNALGLAVRVFPLRPA